MSAEPFRETYGFGQPIRRFLFKPLEAVRGGGCHAEVHLPPTSVDRPPTGFPVVIVIHGGAFMTSGLRQLPPQQLDYLLAKGLAVVDVEYRLLPHANLIDMNADVEDAYNWVRSDLNGLLAEGPVDEVVINGDAVGVTGDSAGGYLSLMLGLHAEPPLKAVCPFYGMSDLSTLASGDKADFRLGYSESELAYIDRAVSDGPLASAHPDWFDPSPRTAWRKAAMMSESLVSHLVPDDSPANRRRLSALHRATASYPPTFLAIPQFDATVAPTQSWRFAERLRALGVEVETGRADDGGHCFDRQGGKLNEEGGQWWEDVTRPALDFLVRHLST